MLGGQGVEDGCAVLDADTCSSGGSRMSYGIL